MSDEPGLRESLALTHALLWRAGRLVRTLAELADETGAAQQADSILVGLQQIAEQAGVAPERRDVRGLMVLEVRRALDVLAEANSRRLRGHGDLSDADARAVDAEIGRLLRVGEALVVAIHHLPPSQI